jgi:hypothetical protein
MVNSGVTPCVAVFSSDEAARSFVDKCLIPITGAPCVAGIETQESFCEWLRLFVACGSNFVALDPEDGRQGQPIEIDSLLRLLEPVVA